MRTRLPAVALLALAMAAAMPARSALAGDGGFKDGYRPAPDGGVIGYGGGYKPELERGGEGTRGGYRPQPTSGGSSVGVGKPRGGWGAGDG
jgi:hypothetical protein